MNRMIKLLSLGIVLSCVLALVPACNTVKGAGKDIQTGAEKTEKALEDATK